MNEDNKTTAIRDIDGKRINETVTEVSSLARRAGWLLKEFTERGIVITLPLLGDIPIKLGPEPKATE